jgi:hypothetical protein
MRILVYANGPFGTPPLMSRKAAIASTLLIVPRYICNVLQEDQPFLVLVRGNLAVAMDRMLPGSTSLATTPPEVLLLIVKAVLDLQSMHT